MRIASSVRLLAFFGAASLLVAGAIVLAADNAEKAAGSKLPLLLDENFSKGADRWAPASPEGWKLIDIDGGKAFSEFKNIDIG